VKNYETLVERLTRIGNLDRIGELLSWDEETHMPRAAAAERGEQKALIRGLAHEIFSDDETGQLLERARDEIAGLDYASTEASVVRVIRRQFETRRRVPAELLARRRANSSIANQKWLEAREANDFRLFAPAFEKVIDLTQEFAAAVGYDDHPYDGLLRWGEPGTTAASLTALFSQLRGELAPLVKNIAAGPRVEDSFLQQLFDPAKQQEFSRWAVAQFGYDIDQGHLDLTVHPQISEPGRHDVRIMTSYTSDRRLWGIFATMHEAGHAMYEQGVNHDLPGGIWTCGIATGSDDFHESQSRLWENLVGRGRPAWTYLYPNLKATFPSQLRDVSLDRFYAAINRVEPSLIRVNADEVTYNMHVILRFEMENDLLEGRLAVADAPEAWRMKMDELLGVTPPDDLQGILQDVHWSFSLGSFHFYTLGNVIAAQVWHKVVSDIPDISEQMAAGDFSTLLGWLRHHIYQHGQKFDSTELLQRVTGQSLRAEPYIQYLREKFGGIYEGAASA